MRSRLTHYRLILPMMTVSLSLVVFLGIIITGSQFTIICNGKQGPEAVFDSKYDKIPRKYTVIKENAQKNGVQDVSRICTISNCSGKVLSRDMTSWHIDDKICSGKSELIKKFFRAELRGPQDTPIFVYQPEEDVWISQDIIRHGIWESEWVSQIHSILRKDKDLTFLDLGANVGVFSLTAAKLGRPVIAVDPLKGNIHRLCKSVEIGKLATRIVLVHNAVSNRRERVALGFQRGNIGGTYVKKLDRNSSDLHTVNSILLDDLLEIFPKLSKVVIKMDVETFEAKVLEGARKFFEHVKVSYLLMEFVAHRNTSSGAFIAKFLRENGLEPEVSAEVYYDHSKWPDEILFKRKEV